jgi:hypothetical protein
MGARADSGGSLRPSHQRRGAASKASQRPVCDDVGWAVLPTAGTWTVQAYSRDRTVAPYAFMVSPNSGLLRFADLA